MSILSSNAERSASSYVSAKEELLRADLQDCITCRLEEGRLTVAHGPRSRHTDNEPTKGVSAHSDTPLIHSAFFD